LSGVYKLAAISDGQGNLIPKIKVSASREKLTLPGLKQVYRLYHKGTKEAFADVIALKDEKLSDPLDVVKANPLATKRDQLIRDFDAVALQVPVLDGPKLKADLPDVFTIQKRGKQLLTELPSATERLTNPDEFPVYITHRLDQMQESLLEQQGK
jgi:nicotinate phosphoribosyltransferase